MHRPWQIWLTFAFCLIVAIAAIGWLSVKALQTDAAQVEAEHQAAIEENARLALWRMDSFVAPIIARENARPWNLFGYRQDQSPNSKQADEAKPEDSGAQTSSSVVTLHFQFVPGQKLVVTDQSAMVHGDAKRAFDRLEKDKLLSQLPPIEQASRHKELGSANSSDSMSRTTSQNLLMEEKVNTTQRIAMLSGVIEELRIALQVPSNNANESADKHAKAKSLESQLANAETARNELRGRLEQLTTREQEMNQAAASLSVRGQTEYQARAKNFAQNIKEPNSANDTLETQTSKQATDVPLSVMEPLWISGSLMLARRALIAGHEFVQGSLLNWPPLKKQLLDEIKDLLPNADLRPVKQPDTTLQSHQLASLPVVLIPGTLPNFFPSELSPIKQSLIFAWGALALAALAAAAVLQGVISLSERRAAFVSAVTHELRTPLTTFRMYAEMLREGMVTSEADRHKYLDTLCVEADRLTHLVANVLAYARLERAKPGGRIETMPVEQLLAKTTERLTDRAAQANFELAIESESGVAARAVKADPAAVEQILFNLVDNACKYAASATDRTLHLQTAAKNGSIHILLCDHGPGISPAQQRRLFQPFHKSVSEAANSAPGVGLGLALSRRLARDMQGDLYYETSGDGACFVLTLPAA